MFGTAVGDDFAGVQRQLHHAAIELQVAYCTVNLGAVGFFQWAFSAVQRLKQPLARLCARMQLGLHRRGWCVDLYVVLFPVQWAIAPGLHGLHPLIALFAQAQGDAARRQCSVLGIEIARLQPHSGRVTTLGSSLQRSQLAFVNVELEFDFHGRVLSLFS